MGMNPRLLRPLATGFSLRSIAGLNLWVDFSDTGTVTLDGSDNISNVTDKSGSGYNGLQGTPPNRPGGKSTLNGLRCADWGTSSNVFSLEYTHGSIALNFQDGYIAAVWDGGGSTFPTFNGLVSSISSAAGNTLGGALWLGSSGTADLFAGAAWHTNTLSGTVTQINNTSAANGGTLAAFPAITSTFVTRGYSVAAITLGGWRIGTDRTFAGRGWRGRIGEVAFFNRVLSAEESLRVRQYLATKWGAPAQT